MTLAWIVFAVLLLAFTLQFAQPLTLQIPNIAPQLTWVVETGRPSRLAPITTTPVTRLAVKP